MKTDASTPPPRACADCRLRQLPCFLPVTLDELGFIQSCRQTVQAVAAGRAIIAEHHVSPRLYTLYAGWAFRYKTLADGRRQILNFLLPGDFIGLQGEFTDDATHGVEALTDTQLCVFGHDRLWDIFSQQPRLGYNVTWLCAREEQLVDDNLVTVGRRAAAERIAMLLIHLWRRAERLGHVDAQGAVDFPLTQQHIADALGLSLVHTNKTLRKLERIGLHEIKAGRLRLLELKALERMADYHARPMRQVPLI
ncbi:Crp/Fnr family transcriptional regulator [Ottowia testudinis]|uniref:Crp/Fnr family transcriptional regulator n=1 Tax=Ottowia testudinis TaxID=2816950 RepID=A0A975CJY4_9BURK|nr:Crp/Fnr family transcriptional regulator [Ottowia testudinis]QTD44818.1 Crp/Fnr family transcriptional regulator [Ottowia testudinis]